MKVSVAVLAKVAAVWEEGNCHRRKPPVVVKGWCKGVGGERTCVVVSSVCWGTWEASELFSVGPPVPTEE